MCHRHISLYMPQKCFSPASICFCKLNKLYESWCCTDQFTSISFYKEGAGSPQELIISPQLYNTYIMATGLLKYNNISYFLGLFYLEKITQETPPTSHPQEKMKERGVALDHFNNRKKKLQTVFISHVLSISIQDVFPFCI